MKKKNKFFYPLCVLLLLGYGLFTACQDEWIADKQPDVPTPSSPLEQARQWYNELKQGEEVLLTPSTRSGPPQLFYTEPSWNWYKISYKDHLTVIDVDLTDRIGLDFALRENLDEYEKTGEFKYKHSITRLVIVMDNMTGEKEGFLMTIIPTVRYARYFSYRMHLSTYLKRDGHLEGLVVFHDLNGKFVNGWKYEGGRAWWTLTESDAETENSISYSTLSASYRIISEPTTRYNSEDYYAGELPEVIITAPDPGGNNNNNNNNDGGGIWFPTPNPNPGGGGYGGGIIETVVPGNNNNNRLPNVKLSYSAASYPGYDLEAGRDCKKVADMIMKQMLGENANIGSYSTAVQLYKKENLKLTLVGDPDNVFKILNDHLDNKRPITAGICNNLFQNINGDGSTDHFVVIYGRGYDSSLNQYYYNYIETAKSKQNADKAVSDNLRLHYDPSAGTFADYKWDGDIFQIVQIRPNK